MGCDIHCVIEQRHPKYEWWTNKGDPEIGRDYELFSVLASVRNYHDIVPISEPKGLPEDVDYMFEAYYKSQYGDAHSASWITLKEMREYDLNQEVEVLEYNDVDKAAGTTIRKVSELFEPAGLEQWSRLIKELEKFDDGTGEGARLVFFFDN
jgi:hypothetical protein